MFSQGRRSVAFIAAQRGPLTGSSASARSLPEARALGRERNFGRVPYCCTLVRTSGLGVAGQEQAPIGWGAEDAGMIDGCSERRAEHPFSSLVTMFSIIP